MLSGLFCFFTTSSLGHHCRRRRRPSRSSQQSRDCCPHNHWFSSVTQYWPGKEWQWWTDRQIITQMLHTHWLISLFLLLITKTLNCFGDYNFRYSFIKYFNRTTNIQFQNISFSCLVTSTTVVIEVCRMLPPADVDSVGFALHRFVL